MNQQPGRSALARFALPLAGLFFILVVAPLFCTYSLRDIFVLPKAVPAAVGVALLWIALSYTEQASFDRRLTPAILALSAATIISAMLSVDAPLSILGPHQQQFYALIPLALYVLAYYGAANAESIPATACVLLALLGGICVSLPAMTQLGGGGFMAWSIQNGRIGSTFGSPIFLGSYLALIIPLAWVKFGEIKDHSALSVLKATLLLLLSVALLATRCRGSILGAAAGVLMIEHLRGKRIAMWVGIFVPVIALVWIARATALSDIGRLEIYRIAIMSWAEHPAFGWGPDTFSLAFRQFMTERFIASNNGQDFFIQLNAHNDVLQILSTLGIVGLAAYTFFYVEVARLLRRALVSEPEAIGIAGAITAMFVNAKFNPIPLAVLVISAVLIGSLDRAIPEDREDGSRIGLWTATAAALLLVGVFGVMCDAERHQRYGENLSRRGMPVEAAEQFNVAARINPFDIWYTQRQLDLFWKVIPAMPGVNKDVLAAFSHNISENIGRLHPNDPTAHELRSLSYLFEGNMLGRDRYWEADHEMEVAERLAPHFSVYTKHREEIRALLKKKAPGA